MDAGQTGAHGQQFPVGVGRALPALVGSSPIQDLTQWRMLLASSLLRGSDAPLARIAEEVGYPTDTAFRRESESPPAAWRKDQLARQQLR